MISQRTLPIGVKAEFDKDLDFGLCDRCRDVGVKLMKFGGMWMCPKCTFSSLGVKEINPSH